MTKYIMINERCYGKIGDTVPTTVYSVNKNTQNLCVGDVIAFKYQGDVYTRVVMEYRGTYGVYGFGIDTLNFSVMKKVVDHTSLTEEILYSTHSDDYSEKEVSFRIESAKEMTLADIEKELGYKIEIVE